MKTKHAALLLLFFASSPALAVDYAFYTDGNFQIIVDAFKRVALFYGSPAKWLIGIFVAGVLIAALTHGASGLAQKVGGKDPGSAFITSLAFSVIGLVVFAAGITPKSDVIVYDKSYNRFEKIADVPLIIASPAGGLSSLVEAFSATENTAKAYTYGELASGSPFQLVKAALSSNKMYSSHLLANIHHLYMDCASTAIASGNMNIEDLRNNTYDLLTTLEGLKHNSVETTTYSSSHPNGTGVTCSDGYDIVKTQLNNPATFDKQLQNLCASLQLSVDKPAEKQSCLNTIGESFDTIYGSGNNTIDWQLALSNILIANVVGNALASGAGDSYIHIGLSRASMAESIGAWEASARYIPIIKGALFAVLMGVAPALLIFIITPLIGKALRLYFGLWGFYGLWLLTDMVVLTSMSDTIYAATTYIASNKMGLLSVWTTQSHVTDALSILGAGRGIGLSIAVTIAALLFGISPHSLAGIANRMEGDIEQKGKQLGSEAMMTEFAGNKMDGMVSGNASFASLSGNISGNTRGQTMNRLANTQSDKLTTDSLGGVKQAAAATGATQAAQRIGEAQATMNEGLEQATDAARINKEEQFAQSSAVQSIAGTQGSTSRDYQQAKSDLREGETGGRVEAMAQGAGIQTNSRNLGIYGGTENRANADHILVAGAEDIYRSQSQSIEKAVAQTQAVDKLNPDSSTYFEDSALRNVAEEKGRIEGAKILGTDNVQKGAAGEYIDGLEQSVTRTNVAGGGLSDRRALAHDDAEIKAYDDIAEHDLRSGMRKDFQLSNEEISQALLGPQELNLSAEQAERIKDNGLMSDEQYQLAKNHDGMVFTVHATGNEEDGLSIVSSEALSRQKIELDESQEYNTSFTQNDSISRNSSVDHDASAVNMNEHSSRIIFSDADKLYTFTDDLKGKLRDDHKVHNEIGIGASTGLKAIAGFTNTEGYEGTTSVFADARVQAEVGTPGGGLLGSRVVATGTAGVEGRASDVSRDERTEDLAAKHFGNLHEQLQYFNDKKVGTEFETQAEADQATAREFAGYYNHLTNGLMKQDLKEFDMLIANGSLNGVWSRYSEDTGVGKEVNLGMPREAWDDPYSYHIGKDPKNPKEEPELNSPIAKEMIASAMEPVSSGLDMSSEGKKVDDGSPSNFFGPVASNSIVTASKDPAVENNTPDSQGPLIANRNAEAVNGEPKEALDSSNNHRDKQKSQSTVTASNEASTKGPFKSETHATNGGTSAVNITDSKSITKDPAVENNTPDSQGPLIANRNAEAVNGEPKEALDSSNNHRDKQKSQSTVTASNEASTKGPFKSETHATNGGTSAVNITDSKSITGDAASLAISDRSDAPPSSQLQQNTPTIRVNATDSKEDKETRDIPNMSSNSNMPLVASKSSSETMPTIERAGSSSNLPPIPSNVKL